MKQRGLAFLLMSTLLFMGSLGDVAPLSSENSYAAPASEADPPSDVSSLLLEWRDRVRPGLPESEVNRVADFVAKYPMDVPADREPVSLPALQGDRWAATPSPARQDWAYAVQGAGYTLIGLVGQGQEAALDIGFWCFLEAALLHPEEREHLTNVGFHLNLKKAYGDAVTVLEYARTLDGSYAPARNNLARAYASQGETVKAIEEAQRALSLRPTSTLYRQRLAEYFDQAGASAAGDTLRATSESAEGVFPAGARSFPQLSDEGERVRQEIDAVASDTHEEMARLWGSVESRMDVANAEFGRQADLAGQRVIDCDARLREEWVRTAMAGGTIPDGNQGLYILCQTCFVPWRHEIDNAIGVWYDTMKPWVAGYETEAFSALGQGVQKGNNLVAASGLTSEEKLALFAQVGEEVYAGELEHTNAAGQALRRGWENYQMAQQSGMAAGCGEPPVPTTQPAPPTTTTKPQVSKPVYLNFLVGEYEVEPNGNHKLTLGQGLLLKLELNVVTGETGAGLALGVNLGGSEGEIDLVFHPHSVTSSAELSLNMPPLVPLPMEKPKLEATTIVYQN